MTPDLHEIVEVLTRNEIDKLAAESNPLFWYVRVSDAQRLLDEIKCLKSKLLSNGLAIGEAGEG